MYILMLLVNQEKKNSNVNYYWILCTFIINDSVSVTVVIF